MMAVLQKANRLYLFSVVLTVAILCCGCHKENPIDVLSLKEMSDFATVEYTVTKIIKANDNKTWYKIGERRILISCEAHIKAGIDFSLVNKENFDREDEKTIAVTLPQPKIVSLSIPPESIKTEYEEVGFFRKSFTSKERDDLVKQGEAQIKRSIDSLGILQQAKANTGMFVTNFLKRLGYENITVSYYGSLLKQHQQ